MLDAVLVRVTCLMRLVVVSVLSPVDNDNAGQRTHTLEPREMNVLSHTASGWAHLCDDLFCMVVANTRIRERGKVGCLA